MNILSAEGQRLRGAIAEAGVELTPDELADGLADAMNRGGVGNCRGCGDKHELRYGWCFDCATDEDQP